MVGIDEVGRGCWAGPLLVVAARTVKDLPVGITDSKLLSRAQRQKWVRELVNCCEFGEGWVSADEIDNSGLANAMRIGVERALSSLRAMDNEEIILDGSVNYIGSKFINARCVIDADLNTPIVSAASIYAKVTRDNFMRGLSLKHPGYGFDAHVGYGTKSHKLAIESLGIVEGIHRMSFKPIKAFIV